MKFVLVPASSNVDTQVELQITQDESESQHQVEEDQHTATETDLVKSFSHQSATLKAHQPNIALDRARRVSVGPPKRYGFEDKVLIH